MIKALATKNVAAVLLTISMVLGFAFAFATPAKADVLSDLQAQVQALLAQIAALQGSSMTSTTGGSCFTFTMNHKMGQSGGEVMEVQKFLNSHGFTVSASGAGSVGNETSYFGPATKAAVIKFQNAYASDILTPVGLTAGNGNWYSGTRAKANSMCSMTGGTTGGTTTGGTTVPTTGGAVSVMAGSQPANSLAPGGASRVPFTTFTLTNNSSAAVTINGVTVQRTGLANDAVFSGIVLVDSNGAQIGVSHTFDSNHQTKIGDTFTIPAGATMTYTVAGNMQSKTTLGTYSGQVAGISVVGIDTGATVSGSLPITGASQTINSTLTIGDVTAALSSFDPNNATTKNIGDSAVKFSGVRLTAGSAEDVKLYSIRWRFNGSASASDMANIVTVVNGTSYPTTLSSDGRYYTATFPGGILMAKGLSADVYVQGDLVGSNSSGRIAEFDIDKTSDIFVVGQTYGYGLVPTITSSGSISTASTHGTALLGTNQPWFQGSTVSIQGGTVTSISNATEVASQNIAVSVPNQPLGGFATNFLGENVTVQTMIFRVATSTGTAASLLTNVSIVDSNGAVVAGPVDATYSSTAGEQVLSFSNTVTFPTGRHVYTLKGMVPSGATDGQTYVVQTDPSVSTDGGDGAWSNITGQSTGNTVSLSGVTVFSMNTMTVRGASLSMSLSTTPSAQTIVKGGQGVLFANLQLDASQSGEDVRVNSLPIHMKQAYVATGGASTNISSCSLYDAAGNALNYGSNIVNSFTVTDSTTSPMTTSAKTFSLNNSLTIPKGTVVTLALKCNVSSSATTNDAYTFGVYTSDTTSSAFTGTGVTSGSTVTINTTSAVAGTQTIAGTGSVAVSTDPSSPSYAVNAGGTMGVVVGVAKFRSSNEAVNLSKIGLLLSPSTADVTTAYIYNGATLVGNATFVGGSLSATSTLMSMVNLPKDTDVTLTIKADLAQIGPSASGLEGALVKVDVKDFEGTGASSGSTVRGGNGSGLTAVSGVRMFKSFPTIAAGTLSSTGAADGKLIRFAVTANSAGPVGLGKVKFNMATTSATVSNVGLFGYTDSGYSTAISGQNSGGQIDVNLATSSCVATNNSAAGSECTQASGITTLTFYPATNAVQIPAGQTYYFELRGSTAGVQSGSSVVTTLLGDATYSGIANGAGGDTHALVSGNFIWSGNATTTANLTLDNDWGNAAGLVGLSSSGLIQTRSN